MGALLQDELADETVGRNITLTLTLKRKSRAWGCNWVTQFLGNINTGTWRSRLWESRIWDTKICSWVPRTRTWEWLCWWGPSATVNNRPILLSERMLQKDYESKCSVEENIGRVSQGAWRQDEVIGGKQPIVSDWVVRSERLLVEAGGSSEIQRKRNSRVWKPLRSNGCLVWEDIICVVVSVTFRVRKSVSLS
jgi:hypothetical protein